MLITVSGPPGSGTTTASARIASRLALELLPGGEVFRAMAAEREMTLPVFGVYVAEHPEVDVELDSRLAARARKGDVVIESRLAGWIAHTDRLPAVTTWVDCAPEVRAQRVADREDKSVEQAAAENLERQRVERERYLALYGIDMTDLSIYDLVLDSGRLPADEIAAQVVHAATLRTW
ncbi:MAG TPA: AAA family ATPase [Acidimicrobiales bacterium]|nr:AAA family ATPase [Acidimicrobiales bacterium]